LGEKEKKLGKRRGSLRNWGRNGEQLKKLGKKRGREEIGEEKRRNWGRKREEKKLGKKIEGTGKAKKTGEEKGNRRD